MTLDDLRLDTLSEDADGVEITLPVVDSAGSRYESPREAARVVGVSVGAVKDVLAGRRQSAGGMHFRFAD